MKKFLGCIFLIFIFSSNASSNDLRNCNQAVALLKNYGYNFQNFISSKNILTDSNALSCGSPPNSNQMITFILDPSRLYVSEPGIENFSGHCIYVSTGQMIRSSLGKCRGW
tara:strand:- start:43 stop:375 length:333 start_codon:yes stop_codon:yes gene_type:complete